MKKKNPENKNQEESGLKKLIMKVHATPFDRETLKELKRVQEKKLKSKN